MGWLRGTSSHSVLFLDSTIARQARHSFLVSANTPLAS